MNAKKFRSALDRAGLTQIGFAGIVGADERTVRRWAQAGCPRSEATLLLAIAFDLLTVEQIARLHERAL